MSREWQPGDVAVSGGDRVMRTGDGSWVSDQGQRGIWRLLDAEPRPLLVIDPEDREQVKRLADVMEEWHGRIPYSDVREEGDLDHVTATQAALRSLLDPKPPEPQGLGAVVRDRAGARWVRFPGNRNWRRVGLDEWRDYSDIDVASEDDILSEGVEVDR